MAQNANMIQNFSINYTLNVAAISDPQLDLQRQNAHETIKNLHNFLSESNIAKNFDHFFEENVRKEFQNKAKITFSKIEYKALQKTDDILFKFLFDECTEDFEIDMCSFVDKAGLNQIERVVAHKRHIELHISAETNDKVLLLGEICINEEKGPAKITQLVNGFQHLEKALKALEIDVVFLLVFNGQLKTFQNQVPSLLTDINNKMTHYPRFKGCCLIYLSFPSDRSLKPVLDFFDLLALKSDKGYNITFNAPMINAPMNVNNQPGFADIVSNPADAKTKTAEVPKKNAKEPTEATFSTHSDSKEETKTNVHENKPHEKNVQQSTKAASSKTQQEVPGNTKKAADRPNAQSKSDEKIRYVDSKVFARNTQQVYLPKNKEKK